MTYSTAYLLYPCQDGEKLIAHLLDAMDIHGARRDDLPALDPNGPLSSIAPFEVPFEGQKIVVYVQWMGRAFDRGTSVGWLSPLRSGEWVIVSGFQPLLSAHHGYLDKLSMLTGGFPASEDIVRDGSDWRAPASDIVLSGVNVLRHRVMKVLGRYEMADVMDGIRTSETDHEFEAFSPVSAVEERK